MNETDSMTINLVPTGASAVSQTAESSLESENNANGKSYSRFRDCVVKILSSKYRCVVKILKGFFILLSIPFFVSIVFFSAYDTKCIVFEEASVMNCTQGIFFPNPIHWVHASLIMSIISSVNFILIVYCDHKAFNYQCEKVKPKKICTKGSFWSLICLFGFTEAFYAIRVISNITSNTIGVFISVLLLFWPCITVARVCCLNYLPRVHWKETGQPRCTFVWWKNTLAKNSNCFIYWLALVVYFFEALSNLTAVLFDVAQDVAPVIQHTFPRETGKFRPVMVIVIGFHLAFHARLLSFFWGKLFHGDKDLFTEPSDKLYDEKWVQLENEKGN